MKKKALHFQLAATMAWEKDTLWILSHHDWATKTNCSEAHDAETEGEQIEKIKSTLEIRILHG